MSGHSSPKFGAPGFVLPVKKATASEAKSLSHTFNAHGDADIILRTSDEQDIYTHKWPLTRISDVFRAMFELPQGEGGAAPKDGKTLTTISVAETAETIVGLLSFVYPDQPNPVVTKIEPCRALLEAIDKYDMDQVGMTVRDIARDRNLIRNYPLESCAISLRYNIDGIREFALDHLHNNSLIGNTDVLRLIRDGHLSAEEYYTLLMEHKERAGMQIHANLFRPPKRPIPISVPQWVQQ